MLTNLNTNLSNDSPQFVEAKHCFLVSGREFSLFEIEAYTHGPNHIFNYDPETGFIKGSHFSNGRKSEMDYYITHIRYSE